jgi:PAS domain S-box-containing protein
MGEEDQAFGARNVADDAASPDGFGASDLGLLDAVNLPIVAIGPDCRIVRINRAATTVLGLTPADVGCSLGSTFAGVVNLDKLCSQVMADGASIQQETRDGDRTFLVRIAPYSGGGHQILGALLTFTNVTAFRASINQAIYEREYTKAILNTVMDPLVVLDAKLRVQTANRAFYALFAVSRDETQGISIRKLGNNEWETSEVWNEIETNLPEQAQFQTVEMYREFPAIGKRTVVLDAHRLERDGGALILLAFHDISERKHMERALRESEERFRALVNATSDVVYRMSSDWGEMSELDGRGFVANTGKPRKDWLNDYIHPDDQLLVLQTIREAMRTKSMFELEHRVRRTDRTVGWACSRAIPVLDVNGEIVEWFGAASDVTARKEAEEKYRKLAETLDAEVRARTRKLEEQSNQVRDLSRSLLLNQDEERRRIARELHDSAGQTLTVLSISLAQVIQEVGRKTPEVAAKIEPIQETVQQLHREIRTTSYLLHPPLLDESGLHSAISWYIEGLRERSGLNVRLDVAKQFGRLPRDIELVIFRLVQEGLTNIHRHSESNTASIRMALKPNLITLDIQDQGKGMSPERLAQIQTGQAGLGIRGMRERLRQFEGQLHIESDSSGTRLFASIPVPKRASREDQNSVDPLEAAV